MKKIVLLSVGLLFFYLAALPPLLFGDEYSLEELYRLALKRAERIRVTEENINRARLDLDRARGALIPDLSAFGSLTKFSEAKRGDTNNVIQQDTAGTWGLRLNQSFSLSGREFQGLDIAGKNLERSRFDLLSFQQDYLLSVAAVFYDLLKAKQALEIANANLDRLTKHRDAAQTRLRVGEVTKTALLRAEGELSGARSDKIRATNGLEAVKVSLARIVGLAGPFDIKETDELDGDPGTLADLERQALDTRPDLKSLETEKNIAAQQIGIAKGAFWPSLSLGAAFSRFEEHPQRGNLNRESISGTVALDFLFYDGGERKADVMDAEVRLRQAELLYRDGVKSVTLEVQNAYLEFATQQGIIKFLQDQLAYARDNYLAVTKQYEFGLANSIDVIDANNLLLSSQRQLSDAVYNSRYSLLRLKRVTGRLPVEATYSKK